ncbi:MAG: Uncharacterised protein [Rhodospirillaceae bacterium]|nr:MAG: Uncharacterised protein [Rhodospirillaceae bacterium]
MGELFGGALHRVAQADLPDLRVARLDRPGVDRHRVYILQHQRIGADRQNVFADRPQMRHSPQAAHDPTNAEGVGDGLAQTEGARDLEIRDCAGVVAANLEGYDNKISLA